MVVVCAMLALRENQDGPGWKVYEAFREAKDCCRVPVEPTLDLRG
jgi:hypothetical protein